MRKGYWKGLLRLLRGRMAAGVDTLTFQGTDLQLSEILASDDEALDESRKLALAACRQGQFFFVDTANSSIWLREDEGQASLPTPFDLQSFIDALHVANGGSLELGQVVDESDLDTLLTPPRGLLD